MHTEPHPATQGAARGTTTASLPSPTPSGAAVAAARMFGPSGTSALIEVTGQAPAAVLLVDLGEQTVVYANPVAQQLAPGVNLPATLDAWSDAAVLRDLAGAPLSETEHPLSAVGRAQPVPGQAVSAARASELGSIREPLWVVAVPMTDAPGLEHLGLVVFLPLRLREQAGPAAEEAAASAARDLREAAVLATGLSFTMADARADDQPLVWVNPAFSATTGYSTQDSLGRNCRFLQGPATDPAAVAEIRHALDTGTDVTVTLLNYRKDGTAFWNEVAISPIFGPDGELTHFVGIQTDVTGRMAADAERDRALAAERVAREEAERARARLALAAEATGRLVATLDVTECLRRLADLVIPQLADWVIITTTDGHDNIEDVYTRHRDGRHADLDRYVEIVTSIPRSGALLNSLTGGPEGRLVTDYLDGDHQSRRREVFTDPRLLDYVELMEQRSLIAVPLPGRHHTDGALILVRTADGPTQTEDDLAVAVDLGRRAGLIIDNARLYQAEHRIAETLQRSLLPVLPVIPGVAAAAAYQPGETLAAVGGDFYELMKLPDGSVGIAIGDIVGHDVLAAAAMGHLRGLLRACAFDVGPAAAVSPGEPTSTPPLIPSDIPSAIPSTTSPEPAAVLDRVDRLLDGLGIATIATAQYTRAVPPGRAGARGPAGAGAAGADDPQGWTLHWASAGHPPLMVRYPDGRVAVLNAGNNLLLGVQPSTRSGATLEVPRGSTLLAYTDGLVERRGESLEIGMERLRAALAGGPPGVGDLVPHLLARLGTGDDDVALLAVHLT